MDHITRSIARNMFHLQIYEADGQKFEDIFSKIMIYKNSDFQPVRPYGKIGDRKNDGWIPNEGSYFQVYAPEDIHKSIKYAIAKIKEDFEGLLINWDNLVKIKNFYFVINDKFKGVPPNLYEAALLIKNNNKLEDVRILTPKDLENTLFSLPEDMILSTIGHIPKVNDVDYMYISGFTYFMIAWINFEKTLRNKFTSPTNTRILPVNRNLFNDLCVKSYINQSELLYLSDLHAKRNSLVHGTTLSVPKKIEIDTLIEITERINAKQTCR